MKNFSSFRKLAVLIAMTIVFAACSSDPITNEDLYQESLPQKIANFVSTDGDYSILSDIIAGSEIEEWLLNQDNITLFAPNNSAFETYFSQNGYTDHTQIPQDELDQLIKNHIISNEVFLGDLSTEEELLLETNAQTFFDSSSPIMAIATTNNNELKINDATIGEADMIFANGVVHEVNQVVELATTYTIIKNSSRFENFNGLISQSSIEQSLIEAANKKYDGSNSGMTVFAPDNAAVDHFNSTAVITNSSNGYQELLDYVLRIQISEQDNFEIDEFTHGLVVNTLGDSFTTSVSADNEVSFSLGFFSQTVNLRTEGTVSIQTSNGILLLTDKLIY